MMTLSQEARQAQETWEILAVAGVMDVDGVLEACLRDEKRGERVARRYNRTETVHQLNLWLNQRGIYMRDRGTWPRPKAKLKLFKPDGVI